MKSKALNIISIVAAFSLVGILLTQGIWLQKTTVTAQKQFDHRADQMLANIVEELQTYADTSNEITIHSDIGNLCFYDVVDTILLKNLLYKYTYYHNLDSVLSFALVVSETNEILYASDNYEPWQEDEAYKVCLSCIWKKAYIHLSVFYPNRAHDITGGLIIWILLSLLFTLATIGAFVFIIITIFQQKKIAEIKNDFVNNMTHELKTPLSTISVASEVLMQTKDHSNNEKIRRYSKIIFDENHRMRKLVDKVLNIATLEKGHVDIDKEETDIHNTICKSVSNYCFEACTDDVKVDYQLQADNPIVYVDLLHIRNIINNLIDNAIKYSGEKPAITISSINQNGFLKISVTDKGKGISKDALPKVFDKFYRVPSGNIHNVKGFGLGLYYVKTMIEAHSGKVEIHSSVNIGTTVNLYIPQ